MNLQTAELPGKSNSYYIRVIRSIGLTLLAFAAIFGNLGPKLGLSTLSMGLIGFCALLLILWMWDRLPGVTFTNAGDEDQSGLSPAERAAIENMPPVRPMQKPRRAVKRPARLKKIA